MKIDFEKLLSEYGLKVGDKINFTDVECTSNPFTIVKVDDQSLFKYALKDCDGWIMNACLVFVKDFVKVEPKIEPKKKVGDKPCGSYSCSTCILRGLSCDDAKYDDSLFVALEAIKAKHNLPQPVYDYYKAELNKEVEESKDRKEAEDYRN